MTAENLTVISCQYFSSPRFGVNLRSANRMDAYNWPESQFMRESEMHCPKLSVTALFLCACDDSFVNYVAYAAYILLLS